MAVPMARPPIEKAIMWKIVIALSVLVPLGGCAKGGEWWRAMTEDPNILPKSPCACEQLQLVPQDAVTWREKVS